MRRLALLGIAACGAAASLPSARFASAPAVAVVNDREDVPRAPAVREVMQNLYGYQGSIEAPITRALELRSHVHARGVNALDEVPDSTWFTNRGPLTPEQIRTGPSTGDSPEEHKPWVIKHVQEGGTSHGFIIEDQRHFKYLLKFERKGFPEIETAIDVVVDRLLWACGYNVPDDRVVFLVPEELAIPPGSKLDRATVDGMLAVHDRRPDGKLRAIVSRYLPGTPIGPPPFEGVRGDDPNDRIPHELRRDVRGMYAVFAWLDVVDLIPGNFLDIWRADPADASRHYVEHYLIDFGKSMGGMGSMDHDKRRGHRYRFDLGDMAKTLLTGGFVGREWTERSAVNIPGVASLYDAASYDPGAWHSDIPFPAFEAADRLDQYWSAKLVARFTRDQLHAAVEAGRFSDPRAVEYLTDTLLARARKTTAYWFSRVAPLEHFTADGTLCFDDLAIELGLTDAAKTHYEIRPFDRDGQAIAHEIAVAASGPHTCTALPALAPGPDGYTIIGIELKRHDQHAHIYVHTAVDAATRKRRVIGIWRS